MLPPTRALVAEMMGTLLFVFLGGGSIVMNAATAGTPGPMGIALAHGIGMAVIVSATMNISGGHINPAVTAGLWVARKIDARTAGAYVVAQLVGAVLGAILIKALLPSAAVQATLAGAPQLGPSVTFMQGVWVETVLTFFLVSAVFGTAVSPDAPKIGGFGIGLAIFVDALVGGNLTGAMMNPARAFGPAVIAHAMHGQAVYWIGPLLGAAVAGILWGAVLLPRPRPS
jgi:MIP family channel proteins